MLDVQETIERERLQRVELLGSVLTLKSDVLVRGHVF
jgi:hypothetical protein